jgi:hypothetical protein
MQASRSTHRIIQFGRVSMALLTGSDADKDPKTAKQYSQTLVQCLFGGEQDALRRIGTPASLQASINRHTKAGLG